MISADVCPEVHPLNHGFGRLNPESPWDYITPAKPRPPQVCATRLCRRHAAEGRRVCSTCRCRLSRVNNPVRAAYKDLRDNAKRRKKYFDVTFEQYDNFVRENGYMEGKGRTVGCLHVDRKDPLLGYTIANLQVLPAEVNSAKAREDKLKHQNYQPLQRTLPNGLEDVGF